MAMLLRCAAASRAALLGCAFWPLRRGSRAALLGCAFSAAPRLARCALAFGLCFLAAAAFTVGRAEILARFEPARRHASDGNLSTTCRDDAPRHRTRLAKLAQRSETRGKHHGKHMGSSHGNSPRNSPCKNKHQAKRPEIPFGRSLRPRLHPLHRDGVRTARKQPQGPSLRRRGCPTLR